MANQPNQNKEPVQCWEKCIFEDRYYAVATCTTCKAAVCSTCLYIHSKVHKFPLAAAADDDGNKAKSDFPAFLRILPDCSLCNRRPAHAWDVKNRISLCPNCCAHAGKHTARQLVPYIRHSVFSLMAQWDFFASTFSVSLQTEPDFCPPPPLQHPLLPLSGKEMPSPNPPLSPAADQKKKTTDLSAAVGAEEAEEEEEEAKEEEQKQACRFWNRGGCRPYHGRSCDYPHYCSKCHATDHGASACPSVPSKRRCHNNFFCQAGIRCPRFHTPTELQAFHLDPTGQGRGSAPVKTDYCAKGDGSRKCPGVATCTWAHSAEEANCIRCRQKGHIGKECSF